MATVTRTRTLINPHGRRNAQRRLTLAQRLAGFGGKRSQAAARTARRRNRAKPTAHRMRTRPARRNVSAIITAGLPFANPAPRKRNKAMSAKSTTTRRRRSHAISHHRRRNRTTTYRRKNASRRRTNGARHHRSHRSRTQIVYRTRYRARARRNGFRRIAHRNPNLSSGKGLLMHGIWGAAGAVGSRVLPQMFLGAGNTGFMGYAANVGTGLVLGWAAKKFVGREAGASVIFGMAIALVLRLVQDFTPFGQYVTQGNLGAIGDMGVILPSGFVDPALFTGSGAQRVIPGPMRAALAPPPAAATPAAAPGGGYKRGVATGMGASTYGFSTYGR